MATLAQVVSAVMDNNRSANNGVFTEQLDQNVLLGALGDTLRVGGDVTQVANVSVVVFWGTVSLAKWVEVRTSRSATVGVVTKGVDVETSQGIGRVTGDVPADSGWSGLGLLLESNRTGNGLVSSKNSNCKVSTIWGRINCSADKLLSRSLTASMQAMGFEFANNGPPQLTA